MQPFSRLWSFAAASGLGLCLTLPSHSALAFPADRGQAQAAIIFQILASELALDAGDPGIAAATYLTMAKTTLDIGAARRATELAIMARMPQQAEEAAEIWFKRAPNDIEAQGTLDLLHLMLTRTEKLSASLALRRDRAATDAELNIFYDYLAGLASRAPNRAAGVSLYAEVSAPHANRPNVLYTHAMLREQLGDYGQMEKLLRKLIGLQPDHAHAHNALGYHFADRNERLEEALMLIERAHALAPNDGHILDSVGWVHFRLGNLDLAEKYLRQAHRQQPDTEVSSHLGEVLWVKGEQAEARSLWRSAFSTDPSNTLLIDTLRRLGVPTSDIHPE
jgi:tetratricopeptide (TPR) repeat protein